MSKQILHDMVTVEGEVIHGAKLGRQMGFPTANMEVGGVDIENGVYLSSVTIDGRVWRAMSNVGVRPSVDGRSRLLETHIFDFQGDLYGRVLRVDLLRKVRDEKKFSSIEELKNQLMQDFNQIRSM
ncbi:MAG: riboflavin kinase [Alistipes sp.]|nr:riboflavin kinase [Alistipes sp.]MBQ7342060.1 riboflavin kinase [Alistipes sp.]